MTAAVNAGVAALGWTLDQGYEMVETERWMGIFHEVAPTSEALRCGDCHGDSGRIDFTRLGYAPKEMIGNEALCAACHEDRSDEWSANEYFYAVHEEHVEEYNLNCSTCHNFDR